VLTESTSKSQRRLYAEHGFDTSKYNELVLEMTDLRRQIKSIAAEYGLEWEQGKTNVGKESSKAMDAVRKTERQQDGGNGKNGKESGEDEDEEDAPENKKLHP